MNFPSIIFKPHHLIRIILRKCKQKKFILIIFLIGFYLIFNELLSFYLLLKCWRLKFEALNQICKSYFHNEFIGLACEQFCVQRSLKLSDCPNLMYHKGKDYVFNVIDKDANEFILKSRELPNNFVINLIDYPIKDRTLLVYSIEQLIKETFKGALDRNEIKQNLLPSNKATNLDDLISLDFVTLLNLYKLLQDNEYLLGTILNNVDQFKSFKILPSIISTCGNWYLVEKSNFIVNYDYLDQTHSTKSKLRIAKKLIDFLINFERMNIKFELCDVKYEHFAGDNLNSSLLLIDSDMIYHNLNAEENIKAIQNCQKNEDCDFNDCKGICNLQPNGTANCRPDEMDNNLKRICRNLFFLEPFHFDQLYKSNSLGLLVNLDQNLESTVKLVYDLCFTDNLISSQTNKSYLLNERIELIRTNLIALLNDL